MTKKILIVDPYYGGSHRHWADGLRKYSRFTISVLSLPARHWKWRMHGGAVTLAEEFNKLKSPPDLILATDMMDVATFIGLIQQTTKVPIPVVTYFHENQLAYPKSVQDSDLQTSRDDHYGFINYTSALVSDRVIFNSQYNQSTFLNLLKDMLSRLPDYQNIDTVSHIEQKSVILYPGIDTELFDSVEITQKKQDSPLVIWNHRWEYDKNPEPFFQALESIDLKQIPFQLAVLGDHHKNYPVEFSTAEKNLQDRIVHFGYLQKQIDYARWLKMGDILPVTSNQDFFGISIVEAIYCGCLPLLPNRLSYPELIPSEYHQELIYSENDMFGSKLEQMIINPPKLTKSELKQIGVRFSWKRMIDRYDDLFESIL